MGQEEETVQFARSPHVGLHVVTGEAGVRCHGCGHCARLGLPQPPLGPTPPWMPCQRGGAGLESSPTGLHSDLRPSQDPRAPG